MKHQSVILAPTQAAAFSLACACSSHATSIAPPRDFEAVSSNGQYRLIADYPEPDAIRNVRDAKISYTLIETQTNRARWTIEGKYYPDEDDWFPCRSYGAYVGNSGGVLLHGHIGKNFTALAASNGEIGQSIAYSFKAPYTLQPAGHWLIAHNRLMSFSFRSVIEVEGRSYLLTRASWGERQLVSFDEQALITDLSAAQLAACNAAERQWVQETLSKAPERLDAMYRGFMPWLKQPREEREGEARREMWKYKGDLKTAMQMVSRFGYSDAIPELRAIERWSPDIPDDGSLSEYDSYMLEESGIRLLQTARLALRRLGERPANYQLPRYYYVAWLEVAERYSRRHHKHVELPTVVEFTNDDVASIASGMPVHDVIKLLGAPDAALRSERGARVLEFDIDADEPFTLLIKYKLSKSKDEPATVETVERIIPPRWTIESRREFQQYYRD